MHRGRILCAFLAASTLGCWHNTEALSAGAAEPGEAGFGLARHTHGAYLFLAALVSTQTGAAHAAMAEREGELPDSLWQVYGGGKRIRHCFAPQGGGHVCRDVEMEDHQRVGWGESYIFVDPLNLGGFLEQVEATASDLRNTYHFYAESGGVADSNDNRMPMSKGHGVWVQITLGHVMHCQLESGTPRCRSLPHDYEFISKNWFPTNVLGVFSVDDEDIVWIQKVPVGVFRCTASLEQTNPECQLATMQ